MAFMLINAVLHVVFVCLGKELYLMFFGSGGFLASVPAEVTPNDYKENYHLRICMKINTF